MRLNGLFAPGAPHDRTIGKRSEQEEHTHCAQFRLLPYVANLCDSCHLSSLLFPPPAY